MVLSNVSPNIKGEFFQEFTKKCRFRYFHFEDAASDANRKRKRPAHTVLNQDPEFGTPEEMTERLETLVKLCVGTIHEAQKRNRTLVERILSDMARRVSVFHTFHSGISSMVEYFFLIVQLFKNYLPAKTKTPPALDFDKKLLRDVFVEMFLLKMLLKQSVPRVYDHLLMIGCSVEDLFMADSMSLFFGSFSLNFSLQFADLMILFGNASSKYSLIWIVLKLLLLKNMLENNQSIFLAARTSAEALAAKKNVFKFYEFSQKNVASGSILYQTVRDYCRLEATPMTPDDRFNFDADFEEDPFSVFKFANLNSFQTLEQIYIRMKRRLSADYKMFDFVYERTDDVIQFFGSLRQIPWKFERDDELAKLMERVRHRQQQKLRDPESDDEGQSEEDSGDEWADWDSGSHPPDSGDEADQDVSQSRIDFENFAEERQLMKSGAGLQKSGLMTSNLLASHVGNMETINEQNETRKSLDIENSFDPESIGDVFRPHQIHFEKETQKYVLRFKVFGLELATLALSTQSKPTRVANLEVHYRGKRLLQEKFNLQRHEFENLQKTHEVRGKAKPSQLDVQCWLGEHVFRGSLQIENCFDNTFERVELGLTNPPQGHIFMDLGLVLQSPDHEPYNDFVMTDNGFMFCLDRMIESGLVLKRPQVLEINSTKKMANIFKVMRAPLKQMSMEFKQEFHSNISSSNSRQVLRGRRPSRAHQDPSLLRHQLRRHRGLRREAGLALGHFAIFPGAGRQDFVVNLFVLFGACLRQLFPFHQLVGGAENGGAHDG